MRYDMDREVREAIHAQNMKEIGDAYIKARDELVQLRYQSEQIRRFFRHDEARRTWHASIDDSEIALLGLDKWFASIRQRIMGDTQ